jgi:Ca2+-binding RTX toxin-like protein
VQSFFTWDDPSNPYNQLQQVKFDDGTVWNAAAILAKLYAGSAAADTGSDTLNGGIGNNVYLFGKGDGQDVILGSYEATAVRLNTLQLKPGVAVSEVVVARSGADLLLSISGTTDTVRVQSFFTWDDPSNPYNQLQQVTFTDGTTWDIKALLAKVYAGTSGADSLVGTTAADTINGGSGNDTLTGLAGNDILNGDAGDDLLLGGEGNDTYDGGTGNDVLNDTSSSSSDTYRWGTGMGSDTIADAGGTLDHVDLFAGITAAQLKFTRSVNDLTLSVIGQTDKLVVKNWYASAAYQVEEFRLDDGSAIMAAQVNNLVNAMATFGAPSAASLSASNMSAQPSNRYQDLYASAL